MTFETPCQSVSVRAETAADLKALIPANCPDVRVWVDGYCEPAREDSAFFHSVYDEATHVSLHYFMPEHDEYVQVEEAISSIHRLEFVYPVGRECCL